MIPAEARDDIRLIQTDIQVASNKTKVPVVLELLDDSIPEFDEPIVISIDYSPVNSLLFRSTTNIGFITIVDNDGKCVLLRLLNIIVLHNMKSYMHTQK